MATSKQFKDFVLEQLRELNDIDCRQMMGEYILYYKGVLFGGIYDNRFLVKKTESNQKYSLIDAIPYKGAKPMSMVENIDDADYLSAIIKDTYYDLIKNKKA